MSVPRQSGRGAASSLTSSDSSASARFRGLTPRVQNVLDFFAVKLDPALVVNATAISGLKELAK
jgi:hypothetical protein